MSPLQRAAARAVAEAVREGRLVRAGDQSCRLCDTRAEVLHHHSYAPDHHLDVVPLCKSCHAQVHTGAIPDPTSGERWTREPKPRVVTPMVLDCREMYGNDLKRIRGERGLTQTQAGKLAGMSGTAWQNIEAGWCGANEFTLGRMFAALGVRYRLILADAPTPTEGA